jgi:hypothetical protein
MTITADDLIFFETIAKQAKDRGFHLGTVEVKDEDVHPYLKQIQVKLHFGKSVNQKGGN